MIDLKKDSVSLPWEKILSLLSLARRSRALLVGQDQIRKKARGKDGFLFIAAQDCSPGVLRFVNSRVERGEGWLVMAPGKREDFFASIGLKTTQIVALQQNHGLAQEIYRLLGGEGIDE
ncbi:MAG TPA: hypothetical protein PK364_00285 [Synergistaceae bacterium]|nr:hypothetical protein [Synergistaceae bacterium]HPJ25234.1 hypothetical protein [Synergistaceae bacterium]HPQ36105.1 hypothetical protein [Synergistaceae bacterium]